MSSLDRFAHFLASTPLVPLPPTVTPPPRWGSQFRDFVPILIAVAVLTLMLVTWLAIVRTRRRRRRYGGEGGATLVRYRRPKLEDTGFLSLLVPRRRRRRRKHRYHHRNPTLAETGGLPPIRQPYATGSQPGPASSPLTAPGPGDAPTPAGMAVHGPPTNVSSEMSPGGPGTLAPPPPSSSPPAPASPGPSGAPAS